MTNREMLIVSAGIVIVLFLLYFLLFKSPETKEYYLSSSVELDPQVKKVVKIFGPDVLGIVPDSVRKQKSKDEEIELLLRRAGNPWNVTPDEFFLLRCVGAAVGLLGGMVFGIFVGYAITPILGLTMAVLMPLFGWFYPSTQYERIANERDMMFKKRLPEAIDLLSMALSGGNYTLIMGIEEVIPHMEDSPVKDEFTQIVQDVDSGMSVTQALENFSERVPTDGIKAFVKSLVNANKLSVDMTTILDARAKESRKELRDEAEKRIAALPNRVMGVLSPASAITIMIIAVAPFAYMLSQFL